MEIKEHLLRNDSVEFVESPNHGGKLKNGRPDSIVIHYTAGGSAKGAIRTLCNPQRQASAHVVVDKDGSITQLVPFDTVAWHAGKSSYEGRHGFNNFSVGIEIDNAGRLEKTEEGYTSWFGREYPAREVIRAVHKNRSEPAYWHKYTEEQINAVFELCTLLIQTYPIDLIVGHDDISPSRKTDPGPAFPLIKLRERLIEKDRALEGGEEERAFSGITGTVTASKLNIRSAPRLEAGKIAPPLAAGTLLEILDESDGWYRVNVVTRGWVSKQYVST